MLYKERRRWNRGKLSGLALTFPWIVFDDIAKKKGAIIICTNNDV